MWSKKLTESIIALTQREDYRKAGLLMQKAGIMQIRQVAFCRQDGKSLALSGTIWMERMKNIHALWYRMTGRK